MEIAWAQDEDSFQRVQTLQTPWFVDFADLNGDQIKDMVGVYGNSNAEIKVFYGNANGTFQLANTYIGGGEYYKVFLQNINSDNIPDIVAQSDISGLMLLSSPAGYGAATLPALPPYNSGTTLFSDFNNDGQTDIFVKNQVFIIVNNSYNSTASIPGNGDAEAVNYNNDSFMDILMVNSGSGTVDFYAGNGNGTFDSPVSKTITAQAAISYDLNTDGFIDIILKGYNGEITILYNDASFSFSQSTTIQLGIIFSQH